MKSLYAAITTFNNDQDLTPKVLPMLMKVILVFAMGVFLVGLINALNAGKESMIDGIATLFMFGGSAILGVIILRIVFEWIHTQYENKNMLRRLLGNH